MSTQITNKKGFTLIEVVIVLAIAALILAGIFVAVSGAQQSRRDTQRKDDAASVLSLLEQSASNFDSNYPNTPGGDVLVGPTSFNSKYLSAGATNMRDPSTGAIYTLVPGGAVGACPAWVAAGRMTYAVNGRRIQVCVDLESQDSAPYRN